MTLLQAESHSSTVRTVITFYFLQSQHGLGWKGSLWGLFSSQRSCVWLSWLPLGRGCVSTQEHGADASCHTIVFPALHKPAASSRLPGTISSL